MKKLYCIVAYLAIITQIINIEMPIFSQVVFGYTVKYILFYAFIIISIAILTIKVLTKKSRILPVLLLLFVVLSFIISIFQGYSVQKIIAESVLFLMPLAVYIFADTVDLKLETYINILSLTCIATAILSVLVSMRVIKTDIWAVEGMLVRSAGAIDSTLFILGLIVFTGYLFVFSQKENKKRSLLYYAAWASCIVGTIFSQSRTRIVLMIALFLFVVLYNLINQRSKFGTLKLLAAFGVFLLIIFINNSDLVDQILSQVNERFESTSSSDINIIARDRELSRQWELFLKNPIVGAGWGAREVHQMYAHNIYTTVLMQTGIICSLIYFCWLLHPLKCCLTSIKKIGANIYNFTSLLLMVLLLVLGYTNAGILQSGGYMCALYVFIWMKNIHKMPDGGVEK